MRSRSTITAALALAAATILAVAACGSSVTGSAQVNTAAAQTVTSSSTSESTSPAESTNATALPTDLSELTALLGDLPTDLSIPTDFSLPSELSGLSIPSDLGNLTNIPGYNRACLSVASAYASISLALLPALFGGTDQFNAGDLQTTLSSLGSNVPPELAPDIQTLADVAASASGKSLTEAAALFESEAFTTAQNHIDAWLTLNCGG